MIPEAHSARGRVLVIDDEPLVGRAVARVLGSRHEVVLAGSAGEALTRFAAGERFDVVLCDLMMPGMTGFDLHRTVEAQDAALGARFVFLTGGAFTREAQEYLTRTAARQVAKPFDAVELRELVARRIDAGR